MGRAASVNSGWAMVGQRVNNFRILRMLGEGGMGAVYEAEHPTLRKKIAIKVLRREFAVDRAVVQRFFNEARAANSIRHPNIIEIIDLGVMPDGVPYLMMELLEGENLAQRLARDGPLSVERAVDFAIQAAWALEAAHRNGIVHRDLKPDNLFLIPDVRFPGRELVKVLDFGIAKLLGDLSAISVRTVAGTVYGTPPYMSPEQCRGHLGQIDCRSDIYSLGIILYEILCGRPPFTGAGLGDTMMMHFMSEPLPPSHHRADIPAELERIILTALAKRPEDRFASMADMTAVLGPLAPERAEELGRNTPIHISTALTPTPVFLPRATQAPAGGVVPGKPTLRPPLARRSLVVAGSVSGLLLLAMSAAAHLAAERSAPFAVDPSRNRGGHARPSRSGPKVTSLSLSRPAAADPGATGALAARAHANPLRRSPVRRRPQIAAAPTHAVGEVARVPNLQVVEGRPVNEPGFLSLDSAPWSNVSVGSRPLGSTPLIRQALPPGTHTLTLTNPELGTSTTYVVEIRSGATLSRFVGWEKE